MVNDTNCRKAEERAPVVQGERDTSEISPNANVLASQSPTSVMDFDLKQILTSTERTTGRGVKNALQKKNLDVTEMAGPNSPSHAIPELPSTNYCSCAGSVSPQDLPVSSVQYISTSSPLVHFCYAVLTVLVFVAGLVAGYLLHQRTSSEDESNR